MLDLMELSGEEQLFYFDLLKNDHVLECIYQITDEKIYFYLVLDKETSPHQVLKDSRQRFAHLSESVRLSFMRQIPFTEEGSYHWELLSQQHSYGLLELKKCQDQISHHIQSDQIRIVLEKNDEQEELYFLPSLLQKFEYPSVLNETKKSEKQFVIENDIDAISVGEPISSVLPSFLTLGQHLEGLVQENEKGIYVNEGDETFLSYAALIDSAKKLLQDWQKNGIKKNSYLILPFQSKIKFLKAFWACLLGGFRAIPVVMPQKFDLSEAPSQKILNILEIIPKAMFISDRNEDVFSFLQTQGKENKVYSFHEDDVALNTQQITKPSQDQVCLILFTSGSTGLPKGVPLTHQNLLAMANGTIQQTGMTADDISLNWMPLDHVGAIVFLSTMSLLMKATQVHTSTEYILQNPLRWLDLIDKYHASISWAPNFAFSLLNDRKKEIQTNSWDLSSMKFLVNAGEQINEKTAVAFLNLLAPHGLSKNCIIPAFGMSETCSGISWSLKFSASSKNTLKQVVGLGHPIPGASYRIVDENNQLLKEGMIGRFQLKGPSVFSGYFGLDRLNQERFSKDGWFDTGDSGFLQDGVLYLTGRNKDDIVINGVNVLANEIEALLENQGLSRATFTAAMPIKTADSHGEKLLIVISPEDSLELFGKKEVRRINSILQEKIGVFADYILPMSKKDFPKTGIGKIQKSIIRENFEHGKYHWQLKKLYDRIEYTHLVQKSWLQPIWKPKKLANKYLTEISTTTIVVGLHYEVPQLITLSGNKDIFVLQNSSEYHLGTDGVTQLNLLDKQHLQRFRKSIQNSSAIRDLVVCVEPEEDDQKLIQMLLSQKDSWIRWIRDIKLVVCGDINDFEGKVSAWSKDLKSISKRNQCHVLLCDNIYDYSISDLSKEIFNSKEPFVYFGNGVRNALFWKPFDLSNSHKTFSNTFDGLVLSGDESYLSKEIINYFLDKYSLPIFHLKLQSDEPLMDGCQLIEGATISEQICKLHQQSGNFLHLHMATKSPCFIYPEIAKTLGSNFTTIKVSSYNGGFDTILEKARHDLHGRYFYLDSQWSENSSQRDLAELLLFIENNQSQMASVRKNEALLTGSIPDLHSPAEKLKIYYKEDITDVSNLKQLSKMELLKKEISFEKIGEFPLDYKGDIDEIALSHKKGKSALPVAEGHSIAKKVAKIWGEVLGISNVPYDETFFDLGGHSLLIAKTQNLLQKELARKISVVELFKFPTIGEFSKYIQELEVGNKTLKNHGFTRAENRKKQLKDQKTTDIAVIGMSCRFPGANTPEEFWQNLVEGKDCITFFDEKEAREAGVHPDWYQSPNYVFASPVLENIDQFDPEFFGISGRDAELMDPQQRLAIEVAWETLERAGYNPHQYRGSIGVYAGAGMNTYLMNNVFPSRNELVTPNSLEVMNLESLGGFQIMITNDKDYISTRISYCLNVKGPSVNVQTACSTTLVSIHMACQSLINGEMDMALTGGVSIKVPQKSGYSHAEGMIVASDGHCKAFDERADGTIFGNGCGFVLLKRLDDAIKDGDHIHAVIKGTALNNDGGDKIGYAAPSEKGESAAIAEAMAVAGISADSIGFVEAHGTGTELGDPIEVSALTEAYRYTSDQKNYCAVGSVKTNVGHLQIASGIVGFMKTVLAVENGLVPATLHFTKANPKIAFESSPFFVNTECIPWPLKNKIRRAGVNSLGIGGANTHVVLEEFSHDYPGFTDEKNALVTMSAKTPKALLENIKQLKDYIAQKSNLSYKDISYTLNIGRVHFDHRVCAVVESNDDLLLALENFEQEVESAYSRRSYKLAFLFSGQGSQYCQMGRELYEKENSFREVMNLCDEIFTDEYQYSLLDVIFGDDEKKLAETKNTQPALFAIEVALAKYWIQIGMEPQYVMGHSLGEYSAACIAGVFSIEDGMRLVMARSRLMGQVRATGGMLSVKSSYDELLPYIKNKKISFAAFNGPTSIVLSGDIKCLNEISADLTQNNIKHQFLNVSQAFHSHLMNEMINEFNACLTEVSFAAPKYDIVSNITGKLIGDALLTKQYWLDHVLSPVHFYQSVQFLEEEGIECLLEIGPQSTLLGMAKSFIKNNKIQTVSSLRKGQDASYSLLNAVKEIYLLGNQIDWTAFHQDHKRKKVILPTYSFQKESYWIDASKPSIGNSFSPNIKFKSDLEALLWEKINLKKFNSINYRQKYSSTNLKYLKEHIVFEEYVVPGAGHLVLFSEVCAKECDGFNFILSDVVFPTALVVDHKGFVDADLLLTINQKKGDIQLNQSDNDDLIYASAKILLEKPTVKVLPLDEIRQSCSKEVDVKHFYDQFEQRGIQLGPTFRGIRNLWKGESNCFAEIETIASDATANWRVTPGVMDSCIQILMAICDVPSDKTVVPFGMDKVEFKDNQPTQTMISYFEEIKNLPAGMFGGNVIIANNKGEVLIKISGFKVRVISKKQIQKTLKAKDVSIYQMNLEKDPSTQEEMSKAPSIIISELGFLSTFNEFTFQNSLEINRFDNESDVAQFISFMKKFIDKDLNVIFTFNCKDEKSDILSASNIIFSFQKIKSALANWQKGNLFLVVEGAADHARSLAIQSIAKVLFHEWSPIKVALVLTESGQIIKNLSGEKFEYPYLEVIDGENYIPKWQSWKSVAVKKKLSLEKEVVITGGFGSLGQHTLNLLAENGFKSFTLIGRKKENDEVLQNLLRLKDKGIHIQCCYFDITDEKEMISQLKLIHDRNSIGHVVHAAGVLRDNLFQQISPDEMMMVLGPKIIGLENILKFENEVGIHYETLICYSSISSILGVPSQTLYGLGNHYLDKKMIQRFEDKKAGISINWGPWLDGGMAANLNEREKLFWKQRGFEFVASAQMLDVLKRLVFEETKVPQLLVANIDWQKYKEFDSRIFVPVAKDNIKQITTLKRDQWAQLSKVDALLELEKYIVGEVVTVLGLKRGSMVDMEKGLMELGLDSLAAVDLKSRLEVGLKIGLKATLAFDYPTLKSLVKYIGEELLGFKLDTKEALGHSAPIEEEMEEDVASALERELGLLIEDNEEEN